MKKKLNDFLLLVSGDTATLAFRSILAALVFIVLFVLLAIIALVYLYIEKGNSEAHMAAAWVIFGVAFVGFFVSAAISLPPCIRWGYFK